MEESTENTENKLWLDPQFSVQHCQFTNTGESSLSSHAVLEHQLWATAVSIHKNSSVEGSNVQEANQHNDQIIQETKYT